MNSIPLWPGEVPGLNPAWKNDSWVPAITPCLIDSGKPTGLIIVFPGGGYKIRAEHERFPVAECFNSAGFSSAVLDYRVQHPTNPLPLEKGPLFDAQRAIRLARYHASDWGIHPDRIAVLGFSAGGHLSAMAGTHFDDGHSESRDPIERMSCRPNAMVLCYPAIIRQKSNINPNLVNQDAGEEEIRFYSCEKNVTPKTPPAFIWHTADDATVPVNHSFAMAEALCQAKVGCELHIFPNGRHGLGLAANISHVAQWTELCARWLNMLWA